MIISSKSEFLQLVNQYSINPRNKNAPFSSSSLKSSYIFEGDSLVTPKGFQLTNDDTQSYGRITTKDYLNLSNFEYQIELKMNNEPSTGSVLGIWFYNNKTEGNNIPAPSNSSFSFADKFIGFGIVGVTFPNDFPDSALTRISLIPYGDVEHYNISETPSDYCTNTFRGDRFKIIIKYSDYSISVLYHNKRNLNNHCFAASKPFFDSKQFKIEIASFNGVFDNIQYQDTIQILKISLINKDKEQAESISRYNPNIGKAIEASNAKDNYNNKTIIDLVDKYYDSHNNQSKSLSISDLNKIIDSAVTYLAKIKTGKGSDLHLNEVSHSLNQLGSYLANLTLLLHSTNALVANTPHNNSTHHDRVKLLSIELNFLVAKWNQFMLKLQNSNEANEDIKNNITELQNDILLAQNMQAYIGNNIMKKVSSIAKDIDKKIESNALFNYLLIGLIGVGVVLLMWIYRKLKFKQKES